MNQRDVEKVYGKLQSNIRGIWTINTIFSNVAKYIKDRWNRRGRYAGQTGIEYYQTDDRDL